MNIINVNKLNFKYDNNLVLNNVNFTLPEGSRLLLVGSNGSGKTTLLKILAGKHLLSDQNSVVIFDEPTYSTKLNYERQLIDLNWGLRTIAFAGNNIPYVADIKVKNMMSDLQKKYPERKQVLLHLLEIDLEWRMHQLSDGQRRRVQIFIGLLRPVKLILLDEITNVLDITCRERLLTWLLNESITNKVTIVYSTHIFDGLNNWYTDILCLKNNNTESSVHYFGKLKENIYENVKEWLELDIKQNIVTSKNKLETSTISGGGFAPGRFYNYW